MSDKINLRDKLAQFDEPWSPKIVAELNGQHVKLAKLEGEFIWHSHAAEDELFLVLAGQLEMHLRERVIVLNEGDLCVVPRGVEHKPVATPRAEVLLFEPQATRNTGELDNERTIEADELERL
jgi:mannose-6-phosphate isomerase-like protein (cupin superfamily)